MLMAGSLRLVRLHQGGVCPCKRPLRGNTYYCDRPDLVRRSQGYAGALSRLMTKEVLTVRYIVLVPIIVALLVSACVSSLSGSAYPRHQGRTVQRVELGVVEHVRVVMIEGTKSGVGAAVGSVVGGVAGSEIGKGKAKDIATVLGATGGGMAGAAAEEAITRQKGLEITVHLDSGRLIAVTQAADEIFKVGERVRVLSGQGVTRVTH